MTMTKSSLSDSLALFQVADNVWVTWATLKEWCPDIKTALWFGKVMQLDYTQLSELLRTLFLTPVLDALQQGGHSTELQSYLVDILPGDEQVQEMDPAIFDDDAEPPQGEILPELWESAKIEVAKSIQEVAAQLSKTLHLLPSKDGNMVFKQMYTMNRLRPTIGDYKANIQHQAQPDVCVVLDDSGSVTQPTIRAIIEDVVALSYSANAHLILVSNTARHWDPGTYRVDDVLAAAQYGGTQYEQLAPFFQKDWGSVITIADYDSSLDAKRHIGANCTGRIGALFDISLVGRPTFRAECLGQLADKVQPLLVARNIIRGSYS